MKKLFSVKNNKTKNKKTCHNNVRYYGIVTPGMFRWQHQGRSSSRIGSVSYLLMQTEG